MGSTPSTAHRLEIRRALYLTPSDNKFIEIGSHLLPLTNYLVNGQYAQVQPITLFSVLCSLDQWPNKKLGDYSKIVTHFLSISQRRLTIENR